MGLGRDSSNFVQVHDTEVSRRHAEIRREAGVYTVIDLGSSNGTLINGRRVEAGRLRPGDVLSIANLRYRLEPGQADRASTADTRSVMRGEGASLTDLPGTGLFDRSHSGQHGQGDDHR